LSEQLAPRHQTLKRHDAVVGSRFEETGMTYLKIRQSEPRITRDTCRCRR
jgi:hypothetical protein